MQTSTLSVSVSKQALASVCEPQDLQAPTAKAFKKAAQTAKNNSKRRAKGKA